MRLENIRFNIVFDNFRYKKEFQSLWGFSCYIQTPYQNILFDTGSNGRVLIKNIEKIGLSLKDISMLFLSHPHWDHIGGLDTVIEENPDISIVLPKSFSLKLINDLKTLVDKVIIVDKHPLQIIDGIYSTGTLGEIGEESMIIDTDKGGILIVGCSHPEIVNIAKRATLMINKEIYYIVGGFHLLNESEENIIKITEELKSLGVKFITPTHCSGDFAISIFKKRFGKNYIEGGVGRVIKFNI